MLLLCTVVLCLHIVVCTGKLIEYDADLADRKTKKDDNEFDAGNGAHHDGGGDDSNFDGSDASTSGSSGDEEEDEDGKTRRHKRPLSWRSRLRELHANRTREELYTQVMTMISMAVMLPLLDPVVTKKRMKMAKPVATKDH